MRANEWMDEDKNRPDAGSEQYPGIWDKPIDSEIGAWLDQFLAPKDEDIKQIKSALDNQSKGGKL